MAISAHHRRLHKDISDITNKEFKEFSVITKNINISSDSNNPLCFSVCLNGPPKSPYEEGKYELNIKIPTEYPFLPPKIVFTTKIFHPNIDKYGNICIDILKEAWSPSLQLSSVLLSISTLLDNPNVDDPLAPTAANMYKNDIENYNKIIKRMIVEENNKNI